MIKKYFIPAIASAAFTLTLAACSENGTMTENHENMPMEDNIEEEMPMDSDSADEMHMDMDHSGSGEIPYGLQASENPLYEVGSSVVVQASHMPGMQGMDATISGAYDTTVYAVSYTPEDGSEAVENHKWVIHEELEDPGAEPLQSGTEITLNADHMKGMDGAAAVIDSAEETTVYMIDYTSSNGDEVTNHMWVTENEITAE